MNKKKRWPEVLIGVTLVLVLGFAALAIHAGAQKANHWGPRILENSAAGDVWFVYDQTLLIARPDGQLLHRISLAALSLPGPVNAVVPLPSTDGSARMLVGVINHPEWLIMNGEGKVIERLSPAGVDVPFHETFHLAAAPDGSIAMSTGGDHRVLLFNAQGKYLAQTTPGLLRFANGLWYENEQWWVVDTNHRQVRILNGTTLKLESAVAAPYVGGYTFPSLARRSKVERGTITLSVMKNNMQHGLVMDIDQSGKLLRTYRTPAKRPQPADFLWLENELLVTESDGFALHLFDKSGGHLKTWGDKNIQSALSEAYGERLLWGKILLGAQVSAVSLGLLAIFSYFWWQHLQQRLPECSQSDMRSRLGTPSLSRWTTLIMTLLLFWPLCLAILSLIVLLEILGPRMPVFIGPLAAALRQLPSAWLMPVLGGLVLAITAAGMGLVVLTTKTVHKRMKQPRFEAVLSARALRWFDNSKAAFDALQPDEFAQEIVMLRGTGIFPAFNLKVCVLTNFRVMIFELGVGAGGKLIFAHPRHQTAARIERSGPAWLNWLVKQDTLYIEFGDGRTISGYPVSPLTSRRIAELLTTSRAAPFNEAMPKSPPFDLRSPQPMAAFVLSLLMPGLAQMLQARFLLGLILLVVMLVIIGFVLTPVLLGWIGHFYDVSLYQKVSAILFSSVWALFSAADAWNYARNVHRDTRISG